MKIRGGYNSSRWRWTLLLLAVGLACAQARELHVESDGKKVGLFDETGYAVIPMSFDNVEPWGRLFRVEKKQKFGLYDENGREVLPVKYSQISNLNRYGRAVVCEKGKVTAAKNGRRYVDGGLFGILNEQGSVLVPCQYGDFYEFNYSGSNFKFSREGYCVAGGGIFMDDTLQTEAKYLAFGGSKHEKGLRQFYGVIDVDQNIVVVPANKFVFTFLPSNGIARYYEYKGSSWGFGYWDLNSQHGFEVGTSTKDPFTLTARTHGDFIGNIAPVNASPEWKFYDRSGNVVRSGYKTIRHGIAVHMWMAVDKDSAMTVFDEDGKDVALFSGYRDVLFPGEQWETPVFPVKRANGQWGVISQSGNVVVPFEYENMSLADLPFVGVKKGGKWGLVTSRNEPLVPCSYASVKYPVEAEPLYLWCMKADSLWYSVDVKNHQEYGAGFESVESFREGMAWAKPNGLNVQPDWLSNTLTGRKIDDTSGFKKYVWGVIVDEKADVLFPEPVNWYYRDYAKASVRHRGKAISRGEAHALLLKLASKSLNYSLNTTLNDNAWDY